MEAIRLENVSFEYKSVDEGNVLAVSNVSLSIQEGEFIALVGHNGSGKSTLARLLNGLLTPTIGSVFVYGVDTKDKDKIYDIRRNVGMVFQNPDNQMIASIVEDDIAFGPENLGVPRDEIIQRVVWALEKVGMSEHRLSTPFKMSGGQKQRLAIAGVLAIKPKIMVLDESTAMLDPRGRQEVLKVAHELNKDESITVIHITHYMDEALEADRVIVMNKGAIVADNTPKGVFRQTQVLDEAQLNLPTIPDITNKLNACGLSLDKDTTTEEELINELCRILL